MQDKAKGTLAKHVERVERLCKLLPVLLPQIIATETKPMKSKYELTELSNVIIYISRVN